ncbi:MAG: prolyl oligopeptidase family serine peptidase [Roseibacillus sp.]
MKTLLTFFSLLLALLSPAQDKAKLDQILAEFNRESGIVYKTVDARNLKLTLFLPTKQSTEKRPLLIHTHGGGWSGGDVNKIVRPAFLGTLRQLLDSGVVCASIQYRLAKGETTVDHCVEDCKDAARFLVKNAEQWNLDPDRIGAWGGSAGGHLSLMTALADNSLSPGSDDLKDINPTFQCVVSYYPLTSFERTDLFEGSHFGDLKHFQKILGDLPANIPERAQLLSPVTHLTADTPPILLIHGDKDDILPINQSELFLKESQQFTDQVTLLTVKGARHSLGGKKISPSLEEVNKAAATFILQHLSPPLSK